MICKKCLNEIPNGEKVCPTCGAEVETEKKPFVVSITDEEFDPIDNSQTDIQSHSGVSQQAEPEPIEAAKPKVVSSERRTRQPSQRPQVESASVQKRKPAPRPQKDSRQAIKSDKAIKIIACVCAVFMAVLSVVGIKTDVFKKQSGQTVPLSKLSDEQAASFEEFAKKLTPLFENGFDSTKTIFDDAYELFNPTDPNGLYASFLGVQSASSDESDPAKRFVSDGVSNAYSKVKSEDIAQIAKSVGINCHDDINTADCYYYAGNYYFEAAKSEQSGESYGEVSVTSSKRTSDDDYYVTCNVYPQGATKDESGSFDAEPLKEIYVLATPKGEGASTQWTLKKLGDEPLLSQESETQVQPETSQSAEEATDADEENASAQSSLSFEMKTTRFSAKMSDGRVYANYVVEYPVFENDSAVGVSVNSIYDEVITELKSRTDTQKVDKRYKNFIKTGGSDSSLPLYTHVIASVEYNGDGYVSIFERRTLHNGKEGVTAQTTQTTSSSVSTTEQAQQETVFALPQTTYDGFTFEISTGDFVKKDDLLGKDFVSAKDSLFNAWLSAGGRLFPCDASTYGTLSSSTISGSTTVSDTYGLGKAIYESAWLMTEDGVKFLFKHSDDALDPVTIARGQSQSTSESQTTSDF